MPVAKGVREPVPWLAASVCCSPFDLALHDAYGNLHRLPVYDTYQPPFMNRDLAAQAGTIMGVETNSSQFYPEASKPEAAVHPDLYRRRGGTIGLATLKGPGFGSRIDDIKRKLPQAAFGGEDLG